MSETPQLTYKTREKDWSNQELLDRFLEAVQSPDDAEQWLLVNWKNTPPAEGGLVVKLFSPGPAIDKSLGDDLCQQIGKKLANGLYFSSQEKNWPLPRFAVELGNEPRQENWTYSLSLGARRTEPVVLYPNKVLAVGDEEMLSPLLGLETSDPVYGLPAKWVTFSQSERASEQGTFLFEVAEVVMGHAVNFVAQSMQEAVGRWEIESWLTEALSGDPNGVLEALANHGGLLCALVKNFLSEKLYLPPALRFCEELHLAIANSSSDELEVVEPVIRKVVVSANLPRWLDEDGRLHGIEWKGTAEISTEDHHRMLTRLIQACEQESQLMMEGAPVLLVDTETRPSLAQSLSSLFPDLPVLAWTDLADLSIVDVVNSVNAELTVDPSGMPGNSFTTSAE